MLLLVMDAELDQRRRLGPIRLVEPLDQPGRRGADMVAVRRDALHSRPRQKPALRPRVARTDRLVVRVKQVAEVRVEFVIAPGEAAQQEGFEKPGHVCEMPLGRADIRHRLDRLVLRRQRRGQLLAIAPHRREALAQSVSIAGTGLGSKIEQCVPLGR